MARKMARAKNGGSLQLIGNLLANNYLQQTMLLQFFAQGIAIDAQHLGGVRLVACRAQHHGGEDGLFHRLHHHVVDVRRLLFAQIVEIFFKTLLDNFLDIFFAHIGRSFHSEWI
jgi:hypothetical protein